MNAPVAACTVDAARPPARGDERSPALGGTEVAGRSGRRLAAETEGEVLFDAASRGRYATDASIYQVMPVGVFVPRTQRRRRRGDRHRARAEGAGAAARRRHHPMRPDDRRRAGDRRQQAPAQGARVRREAMTATSSPASCSTPERAAEAARPVVSGRRLDQRAGDDRRHGGQQLVRLALDRLRQHGAQRARHRGLAVATASRWSSDRVAGSAARPRRSPNSSATLATARAPRSRALAEGAAPRRRLQPRHLRPAERAALHARRQRQPGAPAGRRRRHARGLPQPDAAARAAAGARRCSASSTSRPSSAAMDCGAAHREARGRRAVELVDRTMIELALRQSGIPRRRSKRADRRAGGDPAGRVQRRRQGALLRRLRAAGRADGRPRLARRGGARWRTTRRRRRCGRCARPASTS